MNMATTEEILSRLSKLDLSSYPFTEVQELIRFLGKSCFLVFTLHYGKTLTRARLGCAYTQISELSYLPQNKNKECQRASTPNKTMFYGTLVPQAEQFIATRAIAIGECSKLQRSGINTKGIEKITFGKWTVVKDINLVVVLDEEVYTDVSENLLLIELKKTYSDFISTVDIGDNAKKIANFFAKEFAKVDVKSDYDYFLSSMFTEIITNEYGYDGVMYPSVRTNGQWGFNVAIKPEIVDNNMILDTVLESTLYKNGDKSLLLDDKISGLSTWKFIDTPELPQKEICNRLQINDLTEISNSTI